MRYVIAGFQPCCALLRSDQGVVLGYLMTSRLGNEGTYHVGQKAVLIAEAIRPVRGFDVRNYRRELLTATIHRTRLAIG